MTEFCVEVVMNMSSNKYNNNQLIHLYLHTMKATYFLVLWFALANWKRDFLKTFYPTP